MKNILKEMSFSEKKMILERHSGGINIPNKKFKKLVSNKLGNLKPIISEQVDDFLEKSYVKPLLDEGFKEVKEINLPDGEYKIYGGGYRMDLFGSDDKDTGYRLVTNTGIRGTWNGNPIEVTQKKTGEDVYKTLYKDMGYKPTNVGVDFINALKTIDEQYLIKGAIPSEIISGNAPMVRAINGQGNFEISGKKYAFDFKKTLPGVNGKYYFITESATYLNSKVTEWGLPVKADDGTQWAGFVDQTMTGVIIFINGKQIMTHNGTFN